MRHATPPDKSGGVFACVGDSPLVFYGSKSRWLRRPLVRAIRPTKARPTRAVPISAMLAGSGTVRLVHEELSTPPLAEAPPGTPRFLIALISPA